MTGPTPPASPAKPGNLPIEAAIKAFWAADKKISLYVLGDELTGGSIQQVLDEVDRPSRRDTRG